MIEHWIKYLVFCLSKLSANFLSYSVCVIFALGATQQNHFRPQPFAYVFDKGCNCLLWMWKGMTSLVLGLHTVSGVITVSKFDRFCCQSCAVSPHWQLHPYIQLSHLTTYFSTVSVKLGGIRRKQHVHGRDGQSADGRSPVCGPHDQCLCQWWGLLQPLQVCPPHSAQAHPAGHHWVRIWVAAEQARYTSGWRGEASVCVCIIIIIIYPLTARVVGAPQMISQAVSSIFPCSPLSSGTWWTPSLSIPWCCLPTSSSVCLVLFRLYCALQDGFGQTWWTGEITIPLQFVSLYDGQEVLLWSSCLLDPGTVLGPRMCVGAGNFLVGETLIQGCFW